jgi:hypothetical protein
MYVRNLFIILLSIFSGSLLIEPTEAEYPEIHVWLPEIEVVASRIYKLDKITHLITDDEDVIKKHYKDYFAYVSEQASNKYGKLPESFVYSYFIYETRGNSYLWRKGLNPGGIKGRGDAGYFTLADDDPDDKFARYSSLKVSADRWVDVLNNKRFKSCRCEDNTPEELKKLFKCFQKKVYHTDNSWSARYKIAKTYELGRKEPESFRSHPHYEPS